MIFNLEIGGVFVKVDCPDDLYLFEDWKRFFEKEWGKKKLTNEKKVDFFVFLGGLTTNNNGVFKKKVELPKIKNNELYFDNLLNTSLFLFFLRNLLMKNLSKNKTLILHAGGFVKDNMAVLITGDSGSGKSTLIKQVLDKYKIIGDDVVILKRHKKEIWAYPTPLNLKIDQKFLVDRKFKVGAVLTVNKNGNFEISKMKPVEALTLMLDQTRNILNSIEAARLSFDFLKELNKNVYVISYKLGDPIYKLIDKIKL